MKMMYAIQAKTMATETAKARKNPTRHVNPASPATAPSSYDASTINGVSAPTNRARQAAAIPRHAVAPSKARSENRPWDFASISLTGRPAECAAAEQVEVEVIDRLSAVRAAVGDDPESVGEPKLFREIARDQ